MGRKYREQANFFYEFRLDDMIPKGHLLRRINVFVTSVLGDLHEQLGPFYSAIGRPSIDPELLIRMLIVGYCFGIRSERKLCEEVKLHLAYRWFCRLDLNDAIPHHSTFSENRLNRFRESDILRHIFERVVMAAMRMGLVKGEGFAVDASVMEANASRYHGKAPDELDWTEKQRQKRAVAEYLAALEAEAAIEGDALNESDDTTLRFEPLWPAQLVKRSATWTLESHLDCRASNACGDRFRHAAYKRRKAKTDHLVERRFRILLTFHDYAWLAEPDASAVDDARRKGGITYRKLARCHAAHDDLLQNRCHAFRVPQHDRPIFDYRRFNQIVQAAVHNVLFGVDLFDGSEQVAYSLRGGAARSSRLCRLGLDLAEEVHADSLVDFGFRREEAIDVGRRHVQFAGDIGNRRLLESHLLEQALRDFDNQFTSVFLPNVTSHLHLPFLTHNHLGKRAPIIRVRDRPIIGQGQFVYRI